MDLVIKSLPTINNNVICWTGSLEQKNQKWNKVWSSDKKKVPMFVSQFWPIYSIITLTWEEAGDRYTGTITFATFPLI